MVSAFGFQVIRSSVMWFSTIVYSVLHYVANMRKKQTDEFQVIIDVHKIMRYSKTSSYYDCRLHKEMY
jgi:hypothetical protein